MAKMMTKKIKKTRNEAGHHLAEYLIQFVKTKQIYVKELVKKCVISPSLRPFVDSTISDEDEIISRPIRICI